MKKTKQKIGKKQPVLYIASMLVAAVLLGLLGNYISRNLRSNAAVGTRVAGGNVLAFSPAFFGGGDSAGTEGFVGSDQDAKNFDIIVENPGFSCQGMTYQLAGGGSKTTDKATVLSMKSLNPKLKFLLYMNAAYQNGQDPVPSSLATAGDASTYTCDSTARGAFNFAATSANLNAAGSKLRHGGRLLLKPDDSDFVNTRINGCKFLRNIYGTALDGCFYDEIGSAPVLPNYNVAVPDCSPCSKVPANAAGTDYSISSWIALKNTMATQIKSANSGTLLTGNGLGEGNSYRGKGTSALYNSLDYAMAEVFVRGPEDPIIGVPANAVITNDTVSNGTPDWEDEVKMIQDVATKPTKKIMMTTKTWDLDTKVCAKANQCETDKNQIHKYALATYMMGIADNKTNNNAYFFFTYEKTGGSYYAYKNWWNVDLGNATGAYQPVAGKTNVFQRKFQNGMVVINASNSAAGTVDLSGNYVEIGDNPMVLNTTGGAVSSVVLPARTAKIYYSASSAPTDTTPPADVTGMSAVAMSSSQIDLHWNASTDPESGISGYDIYRKTGSAGTYSKITTVTGIMYSDTSLTAGTRYYYKVKAKNGAGATSINYSNEADASTTTTTGGDTTPPTVTITLPSSGSSVSGVVSMSATASDTGGIAFVTFMVDEHTVGNVLSAPYSASYDVSSLTDGLHFIFAVAYDNSGNSAGDYIAVTVTHTPTDTTKPAQPQNLVSTAQTAGSIDIAWSASSDNVGVTGYHVYRNDTLVSTTGASTLSYSDGGLASATIYRYNVSAIDAAGNESDVSAPVTVSTVDPAASALLGDADGNGTVSISEAIQVITRWHNNTPVSGRKSGDKNSDGIVSLGEAIEVLNNWQHPAH